MQYDVIVIGGGATGGLAAYLLSKEGLNVLLLDSGDSPIILDKNMNLPIATNQSIQSKCWACVDDTRHLFINDVENPYTHPINKPFVWVRSGAIGGKLNIWGRQTYRMSNLEFKSASIDGFGANFPFSYEELSPYYDKVEQFIGISGNNDNIEHLPNGLFLPPFDLTHGEKVLQKSLKDGKKLIIGRTATLTQTHNHRIKCSNCGSCFKGCSENSYYTSYNPSIIKAVKNYGLSVKKNSLVYNIELNSSSNLAKYVHFIDKVNGLSETVSGRVIILSASTIETTRLLLNSSTSKFDNGLCNSSGLLGHYLHGHVHSIEQYGVIEALTQYENNYLYNRPNQAYIPRFRNIGNDKQSNFIRGYGIKVSSTGQVSEILQKKDKNLSAIIKLQNCPSYWFSAMGEMLPRFENNIKIDAEIKDLWGIPVPHISCEYSDNEIKMASDMNNTLTEISKNAGFKQIYSNNVIGTPGLCVHEAGTARMGTTMNNSVLNKNNQSWDIKNIFIIDGACLPSSGYFGQTLTLMAITWRTCEFIQKKYRI